MLRNFLKSLLKSQASSIPAEQDLKAYRCHDGRIEEINPVFTADYQGLSRGVIQKRGNIYIHGSVYDLSQDGVYRFSQLPSVSEQRVVCEGGASSLLRCIGYLWLYGGQDNLLSNEQALQALCNRPVVAGCGNLSLLAKSILEMMGTPCRLVAGMSQSNWTGHDDGHTLLEIKMEGSWILYDPSFHSLFLYEGKYLSLSEICDISIEQIKIERLPSLPGHGPYTSGKYDYSFWIERRLMSEELLKKWYAHVLNIPLIYDNGEFYYPQESVHQLYKSQFDERYCAIERNGFLARFYKEENSC